MAKSKSATKRHKQSLKRRARNRHVRSTVKTAIKEVRSALESKGAEEAGNALSKATSVISRAGSKGVLHKKNVARKVARLSRAVQKAR
ncbi:MAG TPA: 30S ribosomal protein S20 [Candidatus Deferrimicrobiaceae bacterium]|nr:30S ribosomal protein S20 [Candidatus Deferrimicrobiaceae bacterium]